MLAAHTPEGATKALNDDDDDDDDKIGLEQRV